MVFQIRVMHRVYRSVYLSKPLSSGRRLYTGMLVAGNPRPGKSMAVRGGRNVPALRFRVLVHLQPCRRISFKPCRINSVCAFRLPEVLFCPFSSKEKGRSRRMDLFHLQQQKRTSRQSNVTVLRYTTRNAKKQPSDIRKIIMD